MLEDEGVDAITVHPRTRNQRYEGLSKWELIKKIVAEVKIPITGNGDIKSFNDAKAMLDFTRCNSVMIGRAAIGNPWIFNDNYQKLSDKDKLNKIIKDISNHIELMKDFFTPRNIDLQIKKQLAYYSKGFKNSKELRFKIFRSEEKIDNMIEYFFQNLRENFQTIERNLETTKI